MKNYYSSKGSVALYIVLIMSLFMMLSALILMNSLSRQTRISREVIDSERAFYGANAGIEQVLFELGEKSETGDVSGDILVEDVVEYDGGSKVTYRATGYIVSTNAGARTVPCIISTGKYNQEERIVERKPAAECDR